MTKLYTCEAHCVVCWQPIGQAKDVPAAGWIDVVLNANDHVKECPNKCPPRRPEPHLRFDLVWYEQIGDRRVMIIDHQDKKRTRAR